MDWAVLVMKAVRSVMLLRNVKFKDVTMSDNSAKVLGINAVWVSTACMLIFVIFDLNWKGALAVGLMLLISLAMCATAAYATKKICDVHAPIDKTKTRKGTN